MTTGKHITVLGAGVIGLSSAIRLLEKGHSISIVARDVTPHTTSDVAAAFWCPYRVGPIERALDWASHTFEVLASQEGLIETGVRQARHREIFTEPAGDPWYRPVLKNYDRTPPSELPADFMDGCEFDSYLIETPIYMRYLYQRAKELGAHFKTQDISSLKALEDSCDLLVNCSGVWAHHIVNDMAVYPIRGQVVVVEKLEGTTLPITTYDSGELPAYVVPRENDCLLGGTAQESNWDLEPHSETASGILDRCEKILPGISNQKVLHHKVGLRPGRKSVRLELDETFPKLPVIHNYGHGGSGFTLSWGCAEEVLKLAEELGY